MAFEHRPNSGTIFINDKKDEKAPDYKGTANIDGKIVKVYGWKKSKDDKTWLSLSFLVDAKKVFDPESKEKETKGIIDETCPF